ncbi:hypothetical protein B4113_0014 [Geobacillus sp. B4113_201601]|nr:hypothetical protein B4113_0014 [Geobacillus sp. B4113_201601]
MRQSFFYWRNEVSRPLVAVSRRLSFPTISRLETLNYLW